MASYLTVINAVSWTMVSAVLHTQSTETADQGDTGICFLYSDASSRDLSLDGA